MKKNFTKAVLFMACSGLLLSMAACSDDEKPSNPGEYDDTEVISLAEADLQYDADGIWSSNTVNTFIEANDYLFSHFVTNDYGFPYVTGFTASKSTDNAFYEGDMVSHPYACISGGGINGAGSPYLVGNWSAYSESDTFDSRSLTIRNNDGQPFMPQSVMVNNNTYAYYSMTKGDNYAKKFEKGDWFKLIAHGVQTDNSELTVEFYLANCTTDDVEAGIVNKWTTFDLTPLGVCNGIYFTMESSDSGQFGMNTPAYFCLDKLIVKE